jgi:electron transfer flavoprotein-quinone oxidoreductase
MMGGGFLYTNKESLCVGLVVSVADMARSSVRLPDLMEKFRESAPLKPLLAGGKLVEYSAHLVPEGGLHMLPTLCDNNVLLLGDAAGLCMNLGYTVRGMDFAVASGQLAAQTVIEAREKGDYSSAVLSAYRSKLEQSFVLKDLHTHKNAPEFMEHTQRMYKEYPELTADALTALFKVDGTPSRLLLKKMLPLVRKAGIFNLLKDGFNGTRAL